MEGEETRERGLASLSARLNHAEPEQLPYQVEETQRAELDVSNTTYTFNTNSHGDAMEYTICEMGSLRRTF